MLPPMLYWNDQLKPYPFDVAKAKALMQEAGLGGGFSTEILLYSGDNQASQIATILKDEWKAIWVDLKVTVLEAGTGRAPRKAGGFGMIKSYYTSDVIDPDTRAAAGLD